jgi:hypothetical protein
MPTELVETAARLDEVWWGEWIGWRVEYQRSLDRTNPWPWTCWLSWSSESGNPHGADWAEYTWSFYGATAEEAMVEAVNWAEALLVWRRCEACGGDPVLYRPCDECGGSGLQSDADARTAKTV